MKFLKALFYLALASPVISASVAVRAPPYPRTIKGALQEVSDATKELGVAFKAWTGNADGVDPLVARAKLVQDAIRNGTTTARDSAPLTTFQTFALYGPGTELEDAVKELLATVDSLKAKIEAVGKTTLVCEQIVLFDTLSEAFFEAAIAKVPSSLQSTAEARFDQAQARFKAAVAKCAVA